MARKNIMLGTAGHVDHGKTALVKLLTGCDTDRLAEEKRRGLTIELGFAPCRMADDRIVGIVDVPGHVSFIRHMVAGAHGVDVLILVVAADDGVMPQTREHLDVLTFMGARHGVIALTKIDMVDEQLRELAIQDVQQFVQGTFLADAPICPLSNITGEGFDGFFEALGQQVQACQPRVTHGPYRQWIERSFTAHGFGVVASGVPCAGWVQVGDSLRVLPGDRRGRVRYLQVYGENSDAAQAGECVAVNLADLDLEATPRGVLLTASPTLGLVQRCAVRLRLLDRLRRPLKEGAEVHLHVGTAHCQATLVPLEDSPLAPSVETLAQLRLDRPLPLAPGDRFVVRSHVEEEGGLATVGGGRVLDTTERRFRRQRVETISPLLERENTIDDPVLWCLTMLVEAAGPRTVQDLAAAAHLLPDEAEANVLRLCELGDVVALDSKRFIAQRTIEQTTQRIADYLKQQHLTYPDQLGVNAGELLEALACDVAVYHAAVSDLIRRSMVTRQGELLALSEHRPCMDEGERRLLEQLAEAYRKDHSMPRRPAELAEALKQPEKKVRQLIRVLADRGDLVHLTDQIFMHREAVAAAEAVVRMLFAQADSSGSATSGTSGGGGGGEGRFTTAEFRNALGASRKYAIPLLDHFDRTRLTIRHGSVRTPGALVRNNSPQ